jgi:hypothetical protein
MSYNWEEEMLEVKLLKVRGSEVKVMQEESLGVQLNMTKIKLLREGYKEWVKITGSEFKISEETLRKIMEGDAPKSPIQNIKNIEMVNLFTRSQQQPVSSSSDSEDIPVVEGREAFLKFLIREKAHNVSRTKTCRNRSKEDQSSRH